MVDETTKQCQCKARDLETSQNLAGGNLANWEHSKFMNQSTKSKDEVMTRGVHNRAPNILGTWKAGYLVGWVYILTARVPAQFIRLPG